MTLKLYNTLAREKQDFVPADDKRVTMYCCGPTVYSYAHIGNARAAVAADVLFRVLRHIYPERADWKEGEDPRVMYARNITDVDDKINASAREQGVDISVITNKFADIYNEDLAALNCLMPTMQPRATAHMGEMIAMIEKLIADGFAYESEDHVFFNVSKYDAYGELSGNTLEQLQQGDRVGEAEYARKKNPEDFVLWKPSEKGDPVWDAPFGAGRPGWHLECSAMIEKTLGTTIDIHCGGQDLKFPHHENEIAQSTCAHGGETLAKYWVHNGFLQMDSEKMSKSLGNVKLVHELLETYDGEVLRFALLSGHYRSELDWTDALLVQAKNTLDGWYRVLLGLKEIQLSVDGLKAVQEPSLVGDFTFPILTSNFITAILDDLNSPECLKSIGESKAMVRDEERTDTQKHITKRQLLAQANLLGLLQKDPEDWFQPPHLRRIAERGIVSREAAKSEAIVAKENGDKEKMMKHFKRSDEVRDTLKAQGIILEDGADGTTWRRG